MSASTNETSLENIFTENFESWQSQLNGSASLPIHQVRKKAIQALNTIGFPGPKNEEYKYTHLERNLRKKFDFTALSAKSQLTAEQIQEFFLPELESNKLVFINGVFSREHSSIISPEEQLVIKDFKTATRENKAELENYFSKYADFNSDAFIALNTAFAEEGSFIHIPDNQVVELPVSLYFINDTTKGQTYDQPRNLLIAGKNSQSTFVEVYATVGQESHFTNIVSELVISENAQLDYYKIQNNSDAAYHVNTTQVWQDRTSRFSAYTFTLNGAMVRNNLHITSDGQGCESHMYGLYLLQGKSHVDNHTSIDHVQPNSESNELYKGIMDDQSHGVFNGKVYVRQAAQKTNAFQSNNNILLTDEATINSKPQLEIWADDVKCSHGCTTGQLDPEALFYLQARGVSKDRARVLLLYAFAAEVVESIKLQPLKSYLEGMISDRLHKDF